MSTQVATWRKRTIRRLLQTDRPIAARSDEEVAAEVNRNFRWNFTFNFLDGAFFWFGLSFISVSTILPLFVSKLSTGPFLIALIAVTGTSSWYLPQLLTAGATERLPRMKPIVINVGFFTERLPLWLLPVAALISLSYPGLALVIFFVGHAAHGLGAGAIAPAWSDMIARCFPVEKRGRFFGITAFAGTGLGALGAAYSAWILTAYDFPTNFVLLFAIAALSITLSWAFLAFTREPVQRRVLPPVHRKGSSWHKIKTIVRSDANFRNYLLSRLLSSFGVMGAAFLTVAAIQRWSVPDGSVGLFTAALLIGQTAGNLMAGFVADRHGHKVSLAVGLCAAVLTFLLAWWAPEPTWFYPVFFLLGVATGIAIVSGLLINMEFSKAEHRPTYVGIANTTLGIGGVLAPLLAGMLALVSYDWVFGMSAGLGLAALAILLFLVEEPRRRSVQEI